MRRLSVRLGASSYDVHVGTGAVRALPRLLAPFRGRRAVLVSSPRVFARHGRAVQSGLRDVLAVRTLLAPDGERDKDRRGLARVHDGLARAGLTRDGLVVALGGGVVGDLAGFAAATYMRGVALVQIPTTLLAMVDSAIGGKVGINHPRAKNLIGCFHQPRLVVSDLAFLRTLPRRQLRSGAYEVLKCGLLASPGLVARLEKGPADPARWPSRFLEEVVAAAARIKARLVEKDEREAGPRRLLNLGHTLGHALEAATGFRRFTHGEAVGWGLLGEALIAHRRGLLGAGALADIARAVDRLGPRPGLRGVRTEQVLAAIGHDKKAGSAGPVFVLPVRVGRAAVVAGVRADEVRAALAALARPTLPPPGGRRAGPSARAAGSPPRPGPPTAVRR
jgi:3-dehydroquinate synthase